MKPYLLFATTMACASKGDGVSTSGGDTVVVDGEAYTLVLEPVMPSGQADLFDTVKAIEIRVTQSDGSMTTHPLVGGDEGNSASTLPPLDQATLQLVGRNGKNVVFSGQTPPISLTEGEHTQPISVAKVDVISTLPDMPTGLGFGAIAAAEDGRFYLFGGAEEGFIDQGAETKIYSLDLGVPDEGFSTVDIGISLPALTDDGAGRSGLTATSLTQDKSLRGQILIVGGTSSFVPKVGSTYTWSADQLSTTEAFVFNPDEETLTEVEALAYPRYGHVAVENHLGEVLVIGGFNDQASAFSQAYAELFDPEDSSFRQISGLISTGTAHHAAARLGEQGVMSCGGVNYHMEVATACTIISVERETVELAFPGAPSLGPAMVTLSDDRILFTGGLDMTDETFDLFGTEAVASNQAWIFESGAWRAASGPMNHPRAWHTASPLPNGRVLITGGVTQISDDGAGPANLYWGTAYDPGSAVACAEIFDPDTNTFSELTPCSETDSSASLPQPTLLSATATDPVHGAVLMGGVGMSGMGLDSVMLYRPSPD